jgi:hypothetical protein
MGGLFIGVVLLFPNGVAGGWEWWRKKVWPLLRARFRPRLPRRLNPDIASAVAKGENL